MIRRLFSALAAFCVAPPAIAQDHLEPENSVYASRAYQDDAMIGYEIDLVRKFGELFEGTVARAIIHPSFETEYGIGVTYGKDNPRIIGLRTEYQLWGYSLLREYDSGKRPPSDRYAKKKEEAMRALRASLPPRIEDVKLSRCEMPLDAADRALLSDLWRAMLFAVRYSPSSRPGIDGETYHFSGDFDFQFVAGKVWSPTSESRTGRLTQIADLLYQGCSENSAEKLQEARRIATGLCEEIGCGDNPAP